MASNIAIDIPPAESQDPQPPVINDEVLEQRQAGDPPIDDQGVDYGGEQGGELAGQQGPIFESPEQVIDRRKTITHILAYKHHQRLGKYCGEINEAALDMMTSEQLELLLQDIKARVALKTNSGAIEHMTRMGLHAIEGIACRFTPMKLSGFANNVISDEMAMDSIAELSLEYQQYTYLGPEKRLLLSLARIAVMTHAVNTATAAAQPVDTAKVEQTAKEAVPDEVQSRYADL